MSDATTTQDAARVLGAHERPILLRLPFSHFCKKAEWGLTRAGIAYGTVDVALRQMRQVRRANPVEKTVPVLVTDATVLHGSHAILRWADGRRPTDAPSLYPEDTRQNVLAWESWADRALGPPVRREAYRVLADDPSPYARTAVQRIRLRLARPLFRKVLDYLDGDRHEAEDAVAVRAALQRIIERLRDSDSAYLFGERATAADVATAALMEPTLAIAKVRGYDHVPGWGEFVQYVRTVRPRRTTRVGKRKVKEADWQAFELLNRAQTHLERPTADQTAP